MTGETWTRGEGSSPNAKSYLKPAFSHVYISCTIIFDLIFLNLVASWRRRFHIPFRSRQLRLSSPFTRYQILLTLLTLVLRSRSLYFFFPPVLLSLCGPPNPRDLQQRGHRHTIP